MNRPLDTSASYPDWFSTSLSTPSRKGETIVDGCKINYVIWGDVAKPGLILLHGSNAHLEWWRMVAPILCDQFCVVALDSSGSGNSGWREEYTGESFAREVMGVARAAGLRDKPYVVGHSFGAFATLEAGHLFGSDLGGVILVDFAILPPDMSDEFQEMRNERRNSPVRPTRVYTDRETALGRFRLVPEQECNNPFLIEYIAQHSLREVEDGWTWKFDPGMFGNLRMDEASGVSQTEKLLGLICPSAFIMAEESLDYPVEAAAYTREITEGIIPMFDVPCTRHHLMFDEPVAVAMAIKGILMVWQSNQINQNQ
jgi:pimeloyl-ACP methyl ester carboxylesterase